MAINKPNMTLPPWAGGSDAGGNGNVMLESDPLLSPRMSSGFTAVIPRYDEFNYPLARADQFAHHINENGFVVWDTNTSYGVKAWVKDPTDGEIYISKVSNSGLQPSLNAPTTWELRSTMLNGDIFTNSIDNNGAATISFNGNDVTDIANITTTGSMGITTTNNLWLSPSTALYISDTHHFQATCDTIALHTTNRVDITSIGSGGININGTQEINIATANSQILNLGKSSTQGVTNINGSTVEVNATLVYTEANVDRVSANTVDINASFVDIDTDTFDIDTTSHMQVYAGGDLALQANGQVQIQSFSQQGEVTIEGQTVDITAVTASLNGSTILSVATANTSIMATDNQVRNSGNGYTLVTNNLCIGTFEVSIPASTVLNISPATYITSLPYMPSWECLTAHCVDSAYPPANIGSAPGGNEIQLRNTTATHNAYQVIVLGVRG